MVSASPRKKRKRLHEMHLHQKAKLVRAHLSKELRKQLGKRSIRVKKGDKVKILRGRFKGVSGKVVEVDLRDARVFVEGAIVKNQRGKEKFFPIPASKLLVLELEKRQLKQKKMGEKTGAGEKA
jgi:large subunit ribosomal protein L24